MARLVEITLMAFPDKGLPFKRPTRKSLGSYSRTASV